MAKGSIIIRRFPDEKTLFHRMANKCVVLRVNPSNWKHRLSMKMINHMHGTHVRMCDTTMDTLGVDLYRLTKITVSTTKFPYSIPFYMVNTGSLNGSFSTITIKGKHHLAPCARFWKFLLGKEIRERDIMWVRVQRLSPKKGK